MNFKNIFTSVVCFSLFFFCAQVAMAQPCPPGCPTLVPIDGGLSFLIVAGAAYGAKKIHDFRKNGNA